MLRVDLPLATPPIIAGLRIATVTTIGLVTVTALVGEGGFGRFINEGLSCEFSTEIVLGAGLSVAFAIACDVLFVLPERLLVPWAHARADRSGRPGFEPPLPWSRHGGWWMPEILRQMWDYLSSEAAWSGGRGLPALTWAHVKLAATAVVIAAVIAIPPAVALGHVRRGALLAVSVVNIGRALPTFAILVLILPFSLRWGFGLGFWPTLVALVLLALPPIFTNTYIGVHDTPPDAVDAARGMGMRPGELVRKVEVPIAWPLIITGLRVSAVQVVATATLVPLVGYINLGTPILTGFQQRSQRGALLAAAITVILLALLTDAVFALAERRLVPWRRPAGRHADATRLTAPAVP